MQNLALPVILSANDNANRSIMPLLETSTFINFISAPAVFSGFSPESAEALYLYIYGIYESDASPINDLLNEV